MNTMQLGFQPFLLFSLFFLVLSGCVQAEPETESLPKLITAPHRNVGENIIDGSGIETAFRKDGKTLLGERKGGTTRVTVSTVALFTLAMAAATGLGAVPFFFVELDPQWAGICNGMAAGVMLAASFDLVQEGQEHGSGNWVTVGILAGGVFIWLCKKVVNLPLFVFLLPLLKFTFCSLFLFHRGIFVIFSIIYIQWTHLCINRTHIVVY